MGLSAHASSRHERSSMTKKWACVAAGDVRLGGDNAGLNVRHEALQSDHTEAQMGP